MGESIAIDSRIEIFHLHLLGREMVGVAIKLTTPFGNPVLSKRVLTFCKDRWIGKLDRSLLYDRVDGGELLV